jgi:hypothetical protein
MSVAASNSKKENLFARLAHQQQAKAAQEDTAVEGGSSPEDTPPSPALAAPAKAKPSPSKKTTEPVKGKRQNPDYCQANCYVPKNLRRAVDKVLLDIDGLDYSTLVEDLLRKWLKSRGVPE